MSPNQKLGLALLEKNGEISMWEQIQSLGMFETEHFV